MTFKFIALSLVAAIATLNAENRDASVVFKKWTEWQHIMPNHSIRSLTEVTGTPGFAQQFKRQYESSIKQLEPIMPTLSVITHGKVGPYGAIFRETLDENIVKNIQSLQEMIDNDMPSFIQFLKASNVVSPENKFAEESGSASNTTIEKYNALMNLIVSHPDEVVRYEMIFAVANKFFEYCFSPKTFREFQQLILHKDYYPIPRMLYSVAWFNLAGNGWKNWSAASLQELNKRASEGKRVVYIAGGSDILQMIRAGVYNITNIDPQLPSQPKYYTNDWEYILNGNIGDTITINLSDKFIVMERTGFELNGKTFKARIATGEVIELPESVTTWTLKDKDGAELGTYRLERRFCTQDDFAPAPNKTLLMSFNELYYIALPAAFGGWMVDPSRFDENLDIVIKQLHKPVTKEMVYNMRVAALINATDFKYIALGTCIN